jgi:glycosyltransferase involved in cell wall biosynthesis
MYASVIFTTYNHPKWLEKTLWGFSAQSFRDFEIIVADDGSRYPDPAPVAGRQWFSEM